MLKKNAKYNQQILHLPKYSIFSEIHVTLDTFFYEIYFSAGKFAKIITTIFFVRDSVLQYCKLSLSLKITVFWSSNKSFFSIDIRFFKYILY